MTNKEAAKHFASLPPDEPAEVMLVNADVGWAETYELEVTTTGIVDQVTNPPENAVRLLHIYQKY